MRIPFLLAATTFLGSSAWAQEDESPYYLQFTVGGVYTEDAEDVPGGKVGFDPGFSTGIAVGRSYELSERWDFEAELEAFYQAFKVDEDDLLAIPSAVEDDGKTFAFMVNGNLDWEFTPQYSIYGGLGVGWAREIDYSAWDSGNLQIEDDSGVAFQARLGFSYNLGGSYDARVGYRFFKTEPVDIENQTPPNEVDELDVAQHSLEVGFRWGL